MDNETERLDILLKMIVAANGDAVSPVQLQKVAFLVGQKFSECLPPDYYEFVPYDYGPFCHEMYRDVEELERRGYIAIGPSARGTSKAYRATYRSGDADLSGISEALADYIDQAVAWAKGLSFRDLVSAIHQHFPAYSVNSIFRG